MWPLSSVSDGKLTQKAEQQFTVFIYSDAPLAQSLGDKCETKVFKFNI